MSNHSENTLSVKFNKTFKSAIKLFLFDMNGRIVLSIDNLFNDQIVNTCYLKQGIYSCQIATENHLPIIKKIAVIK